MVLFCLIFQIFFVTEVFFIFFIFLSLIFHFSKMDKKMSNYEKCDGKSLKFAPRFLDFLQFFNIFFEASDIIIITNKHFSFLENFLNPD